MFTMYQVCADTPKTSPLKALPITRNSTTGTPMVKNTYRGLRKDRRSSVPR